MPPTLAIGAFLETATNVLAFGLPGVGKSHALSAVGHALVEAGHSVLCAPAYALVQELLGAKRDLDLPRALRKLDLFEVILLDDLGYVQQSPDEAEVLFTLLAERYERRSVMVTSNLVFSQWDRIFRDQMATAAAIDRLVHHAVVLEFDVPSFRTDPSRPTSPPSPPPVPRGRPPGCWATIQAQIKPLSSWWRCSEPSRSARRQAEASARSRSPDLRTCAGRLVGRTAEVSMRQLRRRRARA